MNPANRLALLSALRWFPTGLVVPVLVLILAARGLSLAQVGQVLAIYSVVTIALELPTGGLADSWGRRPVVVGSAVLQALGLAGLAWFSGFAQVAVCAVALGVARALSSGPVEAWFVDASHSLGHSDIEPGLAKGQIAEALALGAGSVIGGLLPAVVDLPEAGAGVIALSVPFIAAAAMGVVYAGLAGVLLTSDQSSHAPVGRTVGRAARTAVTDPAVRRLMVVAICLGVVLSGVELVSPDRVSQLVGSPTTASAIFGVLTAMAFAVSAAGAWLSTRLPGRRAAVAAGAYAAIALLVLGIAVPWLFVAGASYLAVYLCIGLQGPVTAGLLHARIGSEVRSTLMSVESIALQGGGAVASVAVGWLVTHVSMASGLGLITVAGAVAATALIRDIRHIQ